MSSTNLLFGTAAAALGAYKSAYEDLIMNGFKRVTPSAPEPHHYYHFVDATGAQVSGYYVGATPAGELAVADIKDGSLKGIYAVVYRKFN